MKFKLYRVIDAIPLYKKITKSTNSGLFLSFLMNHFIIKGRFVCQNKLIQDTLGLSKREFFEALNKLKNLPFLCIIENKIYPEITYTLLKKQWRLFFLNSKPNPFASYFGTVRRPKEYINILFPIINNYDNNNINKITKKECVLNTFKESNKNKIYTRLSKEFIDATAIERTRQPSPVVWGRALKRFADQEKIPEKRIEKVLTWYSSKFDKSINPYSRKYLPKYIPQANSMSGFINKFFDIEVAMSREIDTETSRLLPATVDLTKDEKYYKKVMETNLKRSQKIDFSTLPSLVKSLMKKLESCQNKLKNIKMDKKIKQAYLKNIFSHDNFFSSYSIWMEEQINGWKDWGGDLASFSPEKEKNFKRYMNHSFSLCGYNPDEEIRRII